MKKLFFCLAALTFAPAAMAAFDGVYECRIDVPAVPVSYTAMAVFMSKPDGRAGTSFLCPVAGACPVAGYSLGNLSGNSYSGTTNYGDGFNITVVNDMASWSGPFRVGATVYQSTMLCSKFW